MLAAALAASVLVSLALAPHAAGSAKRGRPTHAARAAAGLAAAHRDSAAAHAGAGWATLNPHAHALHRAAIAYAVRFAVQWWAYRAGPARLDDLMSRVSPFLDARALAQAAALRRPARVWRQPVAKRQSSVPFDLHGYVPALWKVAITSPAASQIPAGTVMVTVTGSARIGWAGGSAITAGLAITLDVVCTPPALPGAPGCVIDYLFPTVVR